MQRDMDLVRDLLLAVEERPNEFLSESLSLPGYTPDQVAYHARLLLEAGYIRGEDMHGFGPPTSAVCISGLTWDGHVFLDRIRDDRTWTKAKDAMRKIGEFSLPALQTVLAEVLKNKAGL